MKVRVKDDSHLGNRNRVTLGKEYDVIREFEESTYRGDFNCYEIIDDNSLVFWLRSYEVELVKEDPIVNQVIDKFKERSEKGIQTYGTTLHDNNTDDFLTHLQEELMDAVLYIQKLKDGNDRRD